MSSIESGLQAVRARIAQAARNAGRNPDSVMLVAVSKTFPCEAVQEAARCGQQAFGENYAQEGVDKILALQRAGSAASLEWHFIGPIQSNKTRLIAEHFDWVHSVDRSRIAQRLSEQRPAGLPDLQVCLQVNISNESTKSGVAAEAVGALAQEVVSLPRVRLRGLMAIPEPTDDAALQRSRFASLRRLRDDLVADGFALDTLSMGMSDDLEAAIAEGSTLVRVGRAIFGERATTAA